jgi:hypothetical protein
VREADNDEIELMPARVLELVEAERRAERALAEVGGLYLEHEAASERTAELAARLEEARERARQAVGRRNLAYEEMIDVRLLPEGEWTLDRERGKLVRRKA